MQNLLLQILIQGWGYNYNKDIRLAKQINLLLLM